MKCLRCGGSDFRRDSPALNALWICLDCAYTFHWACCLSHDMFKKIDVKSAQLIVNAFYLSAVIPAGDYWVCTVHRDIAQAMESVVPPVGVGFFVFWREREVTFLAYAPVVQLSLFEEV